MTHKLIPFMLFVLMVCTATAQNVGIGTSTPNTKLDVSGAIRHQETNNLTITNSSTNTLPANVSEVQLIAGSGLSQGFTLGTLSAANSYFVGQDLLIYNNTNYACTFGSYTIPALQVMHFIYTNTAGSTTVFGWVAASPASSGGTSYWGTSGNTGTTASTSGIGTAVNSNFIGNTDAKDFVLATNNLERMRITSAGYIGINTTSPNTSLDVRTTDAIQFPAGSTAQRPATPQPGFTRYNTDASIASLEYWNGSQWININQAQVPIGTVAPYAGSTAPLGWAICDGSAVSRTTYSALFAIIGTTYGAGDGSTTFNLPDMRGKAAFGYSSTSGIYNTLGGTGGATSYTPSIGLGTLAVSIPALNASLPAHTHAVPPHYHSMSSSGASLVTTANNTGYESSHTHLVPGQTVTTSSGGSHSHAVGLRSIDGGYAASTVNAFYYGFSNPNSNNTNTTDRGPNTTSASGNGLIQYDGVHTHTVTTNASTNGPGSAHLHTIPALAITGSVGNVSGSGAVSGDASFNTTSTS